MPTQRSQGWTDQTRENADGEIVQDKTVSTRQFARIILLPRSGSGSHRRSMRHRSAVANLRLLQHVWKPSSFMSTLVTVIVAVTVCNPTTEVPRSNRTSTELSRLLFVTIEDVVHEDDLRRIRPLKAVVLFDGAVNWSSHHARTESMHQQHTNSVHQR